MRQDQFQTTLTIAGVNYGEWDKCVGGAAVANEIKYRPGGMGPEVSLGGTVSVQDITISRLYEVSRDGPNLQAYLAANGRATCSVHRQPLDMNGHAIGNPQVFTGIVKEVKLPEADGENNVPAMIELIISPNGGISA